MKKFFFLLLFINNVNSKLYTNEEVVGSALKGNVKYLKGFFKHCLFLLIMQKILYSSI